MGLGTMTHSLQRAWTVEIRTQGGAMTALCPQCGPLTATPPATPGRTALAHLAGHARANWLAPHLRICQCRENGCRWHPRHRGCAGGVLLALTRGHGGRLWRLADVCQACTAATPHTAAVTETRPAAAASGTSRNPWESAAPPQTAAKDDEADVPPEVTDVWLDPGTCCEEI